MPSYYSAQPVAVAYTTTTGLPNHKPHPTPAVLSALPVRQKTVNFPRAPTTSILRPATTPELWQLYPFEKHAATCSACHNPYEVWRSGAKLCSTGQELAVNVTKTAYTQGNGRVTYAHAGQRDVKTQIDWPEGYRHCLGLLRAQERGSRSRQTATVVHHAQRPQQSQPQPATRHTTHARGRRHHRHHRDDDSDSESESSSCESDVPRRSKSTRRSRPKQVVIHQSQPRSKSTQRSGRRTPELTDDDSDRGRYTTERRRPSHRR